MEIKLKSIEHGSRTWQMPVHVQVDKTTVFKLSEIDSGCGPMLMSRYNFYASSGETVKARLEKIKFAIETIQDATLNTKSLPLESKHLTKININYTALITHFNPKSNNFSERFKELLIELGFKKSKMFHNIRHGKDTSDVQQIFYWTVDSKKDFNERLNNKKDE